MKFIKGRFKGIDIDRIHRTVSQGKVGTVEMIRILEVCVLKEYGIKTSRERHPPAIIMEQNIRMPRKSSRQNRIMQLAMLPTSRELQPEHINAANRQEQHTVKSNKYFLFIRQPPFKILDDLSFLVEIV